MSSGTYVIADIGACHEGRLTYMDAAVLAAKAAGADAIKFQFTSDPARMARRRGRAEQDGYAAIYAKYLNWSASWLEMLWMSCASAGIDFMCTAFLPEDVAVVAPYVAKFKVASFEALDAEMLAAHEPYDKETIVSVGMLTDDETTTVFGRVVNLPGGYALLHCVSSYPVPDDQLNLAVVRRGGYAGYSDHSDPTADWTGALAVAAGARIIEAHLRLDVTDAANPDYPHARSPRQFAAYVANIRFAERCLGDGVKRIQPCEAAMLPYRVGKA